MATTSTSRPPPKAERSWAVFLAPVGISCVVMVVAALFVMGEEREPPSRDRFAGRSSERHFDEADNDDLPEEDIAVDDDPRSGRRLATVGSEPTEAPRRRGFSPVLRGEPEGSTPEPSSLTDEDEGPADGAQLDAERQAMLEQRAERIADRGGLVGGFARRVREKRLQREAAEAGQNEVGAGQVPPAQMPAPAVATPPGMGGAPAGAGRR